MMQMTRRALVATLAALSFHAHATSVAYETIEEQTRASTVVVRAKVLQSQALWESGQTAIWTWTELEVLDALKGAPGRTIVVKQPGGVIGNVGQHVAGTAQFALGEECIVFLEPSVDDSRIHIVRGLASGKISFESTHGRTEAVRQMGELRLVRRSSAIAVMPNNGSEPLGRVEDLASRIRRAAGAVTR